MTAPLQHPQDVSVDPRVQFDPSKIARLLPDLVALLEASHSTSPENRKALSDQANALKESLGRCRTMCESLPGGDLSLAEQDRLIRLLEDRVATNATSLEAVQQALPRPEPTTGQ